MKTLEQLLAIGSYAGLGLVLSCTADNKNKPTDSDTEHVSDDSGDSGSEPCVAWEQTFGGSSSNGISSVQQTTDEGYVLGGYTKSSGNYDGWLIKTDASGSKHWEQTFGGSESDSIYSAQQTTDEGYVLAGVTKSSGAGDYDGWLIKTDENGNTQWEQTFGGSDEDYIKSVQQTTDGGYVLAGYTESSEIRYGWLIKTDENGNKQWEQTFGGSKTDQFYSVQQTTDGGYVLAATSSRAGSWDGWLVKTDENGNIQWEQTIDKGDSDNFLSIQQTTDRGYVLAGYSDSSEMRYGWLVKTDENGNIQWEQTFGGSDSDNFSSVQQTTDGGYVLAGDTNIGAESYDGWLVKTDENGSKQWEQTFSRSAYDDISSVQQTTDGGYVLAGYMYSSSETSEGWLVKACDK